MHSLEDVMWLLHVLVSHGRLRVSIGVALPRCSLMYLLYSDYSVLCVYCQHSVYYFGFFGVSLYAGLTFNAWLSYQYLPSADLQACTDTPGSPLQLLGNPWGETLILLLWKLSSKDHGIATFVVPACFLSTSSLSRVSYYALPATLPPLTNMALRTLSPSFQDPGLPCFSFLPLSAPGLVNESKVAWCMSYSYFVGVYVAVGSKKSLPVSSALIVLPLNTFSALFPSFEWSVSLDTSIQVPGVPVAIGNFLSRNDAYTCTLCMWSWDQFYLFADSYLVGMSHQHL